FVVFDQRQPIEMAPLHDDPVFANATVQVLAASTVVRLPLEPDTSLSVSREPHAWRIAVVSERPKLRPIQVLPLNGRLAFTAAALGGVWDFIDRETGAPLLCAPQRQTGQSVALRRGAVEFSLLPTWQGVAIEPLSDNLTLRTVQDGFVLATGTAALALSPPS